MELQEQDLKTPKVVPAPMVLENEDSKSLQNKTRMGDAMRSLRFEDSSFVFSCGPSGLLYATICLTIGGHAWIYSCFYRSKMRKQYLLKASPCCDCLVH
ncbi:hypothetical protein QJS10_CPA01g01731 [Acorus calamus]|uniref:Uncharacterized protein n=1 Tax=Acorus calamus TaxID=4465 RepID=A0AAV9FM23_ACOCL|nr:hypothetical protein QJS10_CPA01g01731 [Acorus calamus]